MGGATSPGKIISSSLPALPASNRQYELRYCACGDQSLKAPTATLAIGVGHVLTFSRRLRSIMVALGSPVVDSHQALRKGVCWFAAFGGISLVEPRSGSLRSPTARQPGNGSKLKTKYQKAPNGTRQLLVCRLGRASAIGTRRPAPSAEERRAPGADWSAELQCGGDWNMNGAAGS